LRVGLVRVVLHLALGDLGVGEGGEDGGGGDEGEQLHLLFFLPCWLAFSVFSVRLFGFVMPVDVFSGE
jgi:hypothetical protein